MANIFQENINTTSLEIKHEEDEEISLEKTESLIKIEDEVEDDDEKIERCESIRKCLRTISLGQYSTKFYTSRRADTFSSSFGGIMTLFVIFIVISYASFILIKIASKDTYLLDQYSGEIRTTFDDGAS
jgi:hypothetical protein